MDYVNDPQFGKIIDYQALRDRMPRLIDQIWPEFNLLGSVVASTEQFGDDPNYMTAAAASGLAYMMLIAAGEDALAEALKYKIFTLGWTEEHTGTDLLSVKTSATPLSDDPDEKQYHVTGGKWLINNSYHADYHMVIAKTDPTQNGPRSLSIFVVPHSSTKNWQRLETHVLQKMVLTKYDIDGPGTLVGKPGHGLTILQQMAMPTKYQCSYLGMAMLREAIPASVLHLSTKRIFGDNPIQFNNVFRQLYTLTLEAAFLQFAWFRAMAQSDSSFLQFHGTMLKSWLLLRANEVLSKNLLVAGSKGFLAESVIGRDTFDSFVLPVFDGHYTLNTLMSTKHMKRYLEATRSEDIDARIDHLRRTMYKAIPGSQINADPRVIRKPDFFNYADYITRLKPPIALDGEAILKHMQTLIAELDDTGLSSDTEYKYKIGTLVHWMEAIIAACDMWAVLEDDRYLNAIIIQYNHLVRAVNEVIIEGALSTPFMQPMHQLPMPEVEDRPGFLYDLMDVRGKIKRPEESASGVQSM